MTVQQHGRAALGLMTLARVARLAGGLVGAGLRALWREITSATEWMSHGGRIRPHTSEGSAWDDYTWGMGPPDPGADEDRAEHGLVPPE